MHHLLGLFLLCATLAQSVEESVNTTSESSPEGANVTIPGVGRVGIRNVGPNAMSEPYESSPEGTNVTIPESSPEGANVTIPSVRESGGEIEGLTQDFIEGLKNQNLEKWFNEKTILKIEGPLCAGLYKGLEDLKWRCGNQFEVTGLEGQVSLIDQRGGNSMVFFNISGVMHATGKEFGSSSICTFKWGFNRTLKYGKCWPVEQESALEASIPEIIKWLDNATKIGAKHGFSCEDLSIYHPIMGIMSDDFMLNIFTTPSDFFGQSSWSGKQGVIDACKAIMEKHRSFGAARPMRSRMRRFNLWSSSKQILASNNTNAWILHRNFRHELLMHLQIDDKGLLVKEDIYIPQDLSEYVEKAEFYSELELEGSESSSDSDDYDDY